MTFEHIPPGYEHIPPGYVAKKHALQSQMRGDHAMMANEEVRRSFAEMTGGMNGLAAVDYS